jgi:hypothetical protein
MRRATVMISAKRERYFSLKHTFTTKCMIPNSIFSYTMEYLSLLTVHVSGYHVIPLSFNSSDLLL